MPDDNYYPAYYLRKRQRDRTYAIVTRLLLALVLAGGLGGVMVFVWFQYWYVPHRAAAGVTKQMADARQDLSTSAKLADAAKTHQPTLQAGVQYQPVDLHSLQYDASLPETSVTLQNQAQPSIVPAAPPAGSPPDTGSAAQSVTTPVSPPVTSPVPEQKEPAAIPKAPPPPKDNDKKPVKKAEEKDKPKKAESSKEQKQEAPPSPAATMYRVYAGSVGSRDEAESLRGKLSAAGYGGTIIKSGPDYLLLVAAVDEFDKADHLKTELQGKGFSSFATRVKQKHP